MSSVDIEAEKEKIGSAVCGNILLSAPLQRQL
jgi:hypothetical protein